jgi:aquaporin NIP
MPICPRDDVMPSVGQRLVAEAIGAFALVFAGCGAIMVDAKTHALGHLGVALSFGLVIMIMISALGHISGAHFNPAVTFGFALGRHFPPRLVAPYWAAQLAGAVVAVLVLRGSLGKVGGLGATTPAGSDAQAFLWEAILTAFLMLVILAVATDTRAHGQLAAIAIGGTIGLDALFGGPITGASMNPARSLAPALAGGPTDGLWVYLSAPLVGAAVSTLIYAYLSVQLPHPDGEAGQPQN